MGGLVTSLAITIAAPYLGAVACLAIRRESSAIFAKLALAAMTTTFAVGALLWPRFSSGAIEILTWSWLGSSSFPFSFTWDKLSVFFVMLVGLIGLGITQYSRYYLGHQANRKYWVTLLVFTGSMLGLVLSDSLVLLYVFWELTTITSALLIASDPADRSGRRGAVQALLVTGAGGLCLIAGIAWLGIDAGSFQISELSAQRDAIVAQPTHAIPLLLILIGAFTKSAQFPFHSWLPGAMAAPAPISAFLHSATMVNAGIFLLSRMTPIFGQSPIWTPMLVIVGTVTLLVGSWNALRSNDIKEMLAYSTVAYLGVLTTTYAYAPNFGHEGELLHIANHAFYKSALFLLVGWLEKVTGTRDLTLLEKERWFTRVPWGGVLFGVAALAMAGGPFLLGFVSKEAFFERVSSSAFGSPYIQILVAVASALTVGIALKLFVATFYGQETPPENRGKPLAQVSPWLLIVPALFLLPQIVGGLFTHWIFGDELEPASHWPGGLAFWSKLDLKFVVTLAIFSGGGVFFLMWRRLARRRRITTSGELIDAAGAAFLRFSNRASAELQAGGYPRYLIIMLVFVGLCVAAPWIKFSRFTAYDPSMINTLSDGLAFGAIPALMAIVGALSTLWIKGGIGKILALGASGYGVALLYVVTRAPDLALTQLLVETASLIILLLALRATSSLKPDERSLLAKMTHIAVSVLAGFLVMTIVFLAAQSAAPQRSGYQHLAHSLPQASGQNAVNVILVDFRGADTLGEIAVLVIAALSTSALLVRRSKSGTQQSIKIKKSVKNGDSVGAAP